MVMTDKSKFYFHPIFSILFILINFHKLMKLLFHLLVSSIKNIDNLSIVMFYLIKQYLNKNRYKFGNIHQHFSFNKFVITCVLYYYYYYYYFFCLFKTCVSLYIYIAYICFMMLYKSFNIPIGVYSMM